MASHVRLVEGRCPKSVRAVARFGGVVAAFVLGLALAACGDRPKSTENAKEAAPPPTTAPVPGAPAADVRTGTPAPAERVDPEDRRAMARLAQGYDIDMPEDPVGPISTTRSARGRDFAALLLWPQRDVRLEGLTSYAIEAGEEYGVDGDLAFLEFRRGGKTLWRSRAPFDPKSFVETGVIPDEVTQELKVGDKVTWGLFYDKKSRKPEVKTEFEVVRNPKAEKQVDKVRTDPRLQKEEPLTRDLLIAKVLENYRLYTESLMLNVALAQANPNSLLPLQGIVVALQRLKLEDSRLWSAVIGSVSGHGRADATTAGAAGTSDGTTGASTPGGARGPGKDTPTPSAATSRGNPMRLSPDAAKELARHLPPTHGLLPGGAVPTDLAGAPGATTPTPFHAGGAVPPGLRAPGSTTPPGTPPQGTPSEGTPSVGAPGVPVPAGDARSAAALEQAKSDAERRLRLADEEATVHGRAADAAESALSAKSDELHAAEVAEQAAQKARDDFVPSGDEAADREALRQRERALEETRGARTRLQGELDAMARQAAEAHHLAQEAVRRAIEASLALERAKRQLDELGTPGTTPDPQQAARLRGREGEIAALQRGLAQLETAATAARDAAAEANRLYEAARDTAATSHAPEDIRKADEALTKSVVASQRLRTAEQGLFDATLRLRELIGSGPPR